MSPTTESKYERVNDSESRAHLVNYRLEKSDIALKEADVLAQHEFFDNAVTRLYYACFYAAFSLLILNFIETGSHRGVKTMLSLHFVKTGCWIISILEHILSC